MSTNICSYEGCMVRRFPCSSIAFFALPTDGRRQQWIVNSGNQDLKSLSAKRIRLFCENHFLASDIRSQFNRKTLRRTAVPIPYKRCRDTAIDTTFRPCGEGEQQYLANKFDAVAKIVIPERGFRLNADSKEDLEEDADIDQHYEAIDGFDCGIVVEEGLKNNDDNGYYCENNLAEQCAEEPVIEELNIQKVMNSNQDFLRQSPNAAFSYSEARPTGNSYDDDKHFALSLVGYFQRLSHQKRVIAKLKILSYLTALELNENEDL